MKRSLIAAKARASTSNAGDLGAQQRLVELDSRRATRLQRRPPAEPHAADHLALVAEQIFGDVPAAIHLADELVLGHLHVVEEGLAEGRIAADQQDRLGRHAGRRHVEQEEADALVLGLGRCAHQAEDPVGLVGVAGPHLLAVDQPMIALVLGLGLQARQVGSRARLRIALAPADFAARDLAADMLLLLLVAELEQRRAEHRDAEAGQRRPRADRAPFPPSAPWSRPATARRRHSPSASRARSSRAPPSRSSHCFCAGALERRDCARPSRRPPRTASARAFRAGNWPPARRAFRSGTSRYRPFSPRNVR